MEAIREVLINMIVHRDYMDSGDSSIKIYDDFIEFFNPGGLPGNITVEQLLSGNYSSWTRNKKIAATFKEAQLIEKYGSGIKRIQEGFAAHGLAAPVFENFQHGFRAIVYAEPLNVAMKTKVSEKTLGLIKKNPETTIAELTTAIGVSQRSIERNLQKLQKENKLVRMGPDKGGYWEVKE